MKSQTFKSNMLLMLTAAIWGFAFVAQRVGIKYVGSFTFNGVRFALGSISLIPLILFFKNKNRNNQVDVNRTKVTLTSGVIMGCVLFIAASLQQVGLENTTAGKSAFITGMYMVFVPLVGIFLKQYIRISTWIGVLVAVTGLYLLSVTENFTVGKGDLLELAGAFFWSLHIILIDKFTKRADALKLSFLQCITCSVLSLATAIAFEHISINGIGQAIVPILYGGICSVGIAYTLQIVAQKKAQPSHAAIILSMETVFASLGGLLILNEKMVFRGYLGCALMLTGMLLSQLQNFRKKEKLNSL